MNTANQNPLRVALALTAVLTLALVVHHFFLRQPPEVFYAVLSVKPAVESQDDDICVGGERFQGCCSQLGGIKDIRGEWIECNRGTPSPTCNGIDVDLSGCCSGNNGIKRVDSSRRIICENDEESPSCKINTCDDE